jgi:hypothetical protein
MDTLEPRDHNADRRAEQVRATEVPVAGVTPLAGAGGTFNAWNYRSDAGWAPEFDIIGYHVEATDGHIGKIDQQSQATNESYLVVDTGPWIFGAKVVVPAGTVTHIDHSERRVYLDRSKDEVKGSPEFDLERYGEPTYREKVRDYYHSTYQGRPMT